MLRKNLKKNNLFLYLVFVLIFFESIYVKNCYAYFSNIEDEVKISINYDSHAISPVPLKVVILNIEDARQDSCQLVFRQPFYSLLTKALYLQLSANNVFAKIEELPISFYKEFESRAVDEKMIKKILEITSADAILAGRLNFLNFELTIVDWNKIDSSNVELQLELIDAKNNKILYAENIECNTSIINSLLLVSEMYRPIKLSNSIIKESTKKVQNSIITNLSNNTDYNDNDVFIPKVVLHGSDSEIYLLNKTIKENTMIQFITGCVVGCLVGFVPFAANLGSEFIPIFSLGGGFINYIFCLNKYGKVKKNYFIEKKDTAKR